MKKFMQDHPIITMFIASDILYTLRCIIGSRDNIQTETQVETTVEQEVDGE